MHYTENEKNFWKYHSMGCGFRGEFKRKLGYPGDPVIYECPECGSEYRPEQDHEGEYYTFAGDSIDMFSRVSDGDLIEELQGRGYEVIKKHSELWKK